MYVCISACSLQADGANSALDSSFSFELEDTDLNISQSPTTITVTDPDFHSNVIASASATQGNSHNQILSNQDTQHLDNPSHMTNVHISRENSQLLQSKTSQCGVVPVPGTHQMESSTDDVFLDEATAKEKNIELVKFDVNPIYANVNIKGQNQRQRFHVSDYEDNPVYRFSSTTSPQKEIVSPVSGEHNKNTTTQSPVYSLETTPSKMEANPAYGILVSSPLAETATSPQSHSISQQRDNINSAIIPHSAVKVPTSLPVKKQGSHDSSTQYSDVRVTSPAAKRGSKPKVSPKPQSPVEYAYATAVSPSHESKLPNETDPSDSTYSYADPNAIKGPMQAIARKVIEGQDVGSVGFKDSLSKISTTSLAAATKDVIGKPTKPPRKTSPKALGATHSDPEYEDVRQTELDNVDGAYEPMNILRDPPPAAATADTSYTAGSAASQEKEEIIEAEYCTVGDIHRKALVYQSAVLHSSDSSGDEEDVYADVKPRPPQNSSNHQVYFSLLTI